MMTASPVQAHRAGPLLPGGGHGGRFDPAPVLATLDVAAGLTSLPAETDRATLAGIVERIAEAYRAMKRDQAGLPESWLPGGEWSAYIAQRPGLYADLTTGRVAQAADRLAAFWRNELGAIVKEYATFADLRHPGSQRHRRFLHNVVRNWLIWRDLTDGDTADLATPPVGDPWGLVLDAVRIAPKACRYDLFAREVRGVLAGTPSPLVAEIGGGYGGLAEAFLRREPTGRWIDYDLPETAVIAAYFHMARARPRPVVLYGEAAPPSTAGDLAAGSVAIMPNFALRALTARSADATVNMFSLSEVGADRLAVLLDAVHRVTGRWFLHHNMNRTGVVNRGFERIPASRFEIRPEVLQQVATGFDPFHGPEGDYRWYVYRRPADGTGRP